MTDHSFSLFALRNAYLDRTVSVDGVIAEALRRAADEKYPSVWIRLLTPDEIEPYVAALRAQDPRRLPLYGIPFGIKDNIDLAGIPTTVGCPEFAYTPAESATVVERLIAAGAVPIGKTNLDQFATGLVGVRSPYGIPRSVFNGEYVSGGSSSGSGVAVASGMVTFALGTDTAGSGRVPAAFNHITGYKPTKGWFSAKGVFPACHSLDCATIFAGTCAEASQIAQSVWGIDPLDSFSREPVSETRPIKTLGVPAAEGLTFFGDAAAESLYSESLEALAAQGFELVEFDYIPFRNAALLLYAGPWVAERRHALGDFLKTHPEAVHPAVRTIIARGDEVTGIDVFDGIYRLQDFIAQTVRVFRKIDAFVLPTTGTTYRVADVLADPITLNSNLGYYTNFVNLLDLAAVAVPAGFRENGKGLPFGITFIGPAGSDAQLLALGDRFHRLRTTSIGVTGRDLTSEPALSEPDSEIQLAVVGAHLGGQPLNHQLTSRNARFVRSTHTSPHYRLYNLPNTTPPKPGLVRVSDPVVNSAGIAVEIWSLNTAAFGSFVAEVPPPMTIGTIQLEDDTWVKGFLCEPLALEGADDITSAGGWKAFQEGR
ncbi:MAG TPA: allophanate hydrolase [Chthoniobacterales bacterium]